MINYTEPKLKDFKCFKLPIDELPKCKELLILGNVYNFFGTYKDGDLSDFTQTPWAGEGAASNFMNFGQFVMNGGHATIIASKETCNYYRKLYKEFYKAGFGTTHPKVVLFEIDDTKFLKGNFKIKDGKEEKLVKGEYFWTQGKDGKWEFNYPDFLKSFFENGEKRMFDLIIANPPYAKNTYIDILEAIKTTDPKQITFLCPWAFTNNVRAGKELKEEIEPFVSSYTQLNGTELFGITLKLLMFHANFEKRTDNKFNTLKSGSIEESIVNKGLSHSDMLKDRVFWVSGLSGNPKPVKVNENIEKQLKNSYDGWVFRTVSLARVVQKALVKTENGIALGGVGVKTKEDYERLSECIKSKDFCSFVRFILKIIGDGRDMYNREIPYIPLFTSFEELNLTSEEIERIRNI